MTRRLKRRLTSFYPVMLCATGSEKDLDNPDYVAEPKFDGTLCVAERMRDGIRMFGKKGLEYTKTMPDIYASLLKMRAYYRVVGELVYINDKGEMIFSGSQKRCQISKSEKVEAYTKAYPLMFYLFEIVMLNHQNLEVLPYHKRREVLVHFVKLQKALYGLENIRVVPTSEYSREMYEWSKEKGWEGVVLKKKNGLYHKGKESDNYLKVKCRDHTIFTLPDNARLHRKIHRSVL